MNPSREFYEQVYDSLGPVFQAHLAAGDLHLYETNTEGKLVKKDYEGRVWIHISKNEEISASVAAAKKIVANKIHTLQFTSDKINSSSITVANPNDYNEITLLFQFAKIAAVRSGRTISGNLANYGMDQNQRFEIAKIVAEQDPQGISQFIHNYDLNPSQRYEIAKTVAEKDASIISYYINDFDIIDPNHRYEIAQIVAEHRDGGIAFHIKKYDIIDPNHRFELAKIAATHNAWTIYENIANFELDLEQQFEVLKIAVAQQPVTVSKNIQYCTLDPHQRFEIAQLVALKNPGAISEYIENFKLSHEQAFEIAKFLATQNPEEVSKYIDKFKLMHNHKYEIAKSIAAIDLRIISKYIKNFTLANSLKLEIANFVAIRNPTIFSEDIQNYTLDPDHRFEIAKLIAAKDGAAISEYIDRYDLTLDECFKVAKIAAAQNGEGVSQLIYRYRLTPDQCLEIAGIAIPQMVIANSFNDIATALSRYLERRLNKEELMQEFPILELLTDNALTGERVRQIVEKSQFYTSVEPLIEKIGSQNEPYIQKPLMHCLGVFLLTCQLQNIPPDNLKNSLPLIEELVLQNPTNHFTLIRTAVDNLKFTDEITTLLQLAKLVARDDGKSISESIANYNIIDPIQRFEVAKIAAAQNGLETAKLIANYDITDPDLLFEIAKVAVSHHPLTDYNKTPLYESLNPIQKSEILAIAISQIIISNEAEDIVRMACISNVLRDYLKSAGKKAMDPILVLLQGGTLNEAGIREIAKKSGYYKSLEPIIDKICSQKNPFIQKPLVECLGSFLLLCRLHNIPPSNLDQGLPIIDELFSLREPDYRLRLLNSIAMTLKSKEKIDSWAKLFSLTKKPYTALACMFFDPLIQGESEKVVLQVMSIIQTTRFQEGQLRLPFIKNLEKIVNDMAYSLKAKQLITHNFILRPPAITYNSLLKNAQNTAILMSYDKDQILNNADPTQDMETLVNHSLKKALRLESIEQSGEKFRNTFGSSQEPDAIFRYAASLMKLPPSYERKQLLNSLREFISSVLEGNYKEMRYDTTKNVHLQTIFNSSSGEELLNKWKNGATYNDLFTSDTVSIKQEKSFDCKAFFTAEIFQENQLSNELFPALFGVLSDPESVDSTKKMLEGLLQEKNENPISGKIINSELQAIKSMCVEYPLSNEEIETKIEMLIKDLKKINDSKENEISKSQLDLIKSMYPDQFPSNEEIDARINILKEFLKRENDLRLKKISSFQLQVINLMYPETALTNQDIARKMKTLAKALNDTYPQKNPPPFSTRLEKVMESLQTQSPRQVSRYDGWTVSDTDDPFTLLRSGTAVPTSCLRIDGDPKTNKCLLAYLNDGKNRAIVVNDEGGKMKARAILRLLWDDTAQKPVLFLEKVYPKTPLDPAIIRAIDRAARRRAEALNLPLLSSITTNLPYPNSISSLGRAGILSEYVDSSDTGLNSSKWTLRHTYIQWKPSS